MMDSFNGFTPPPHSSPFTQNEFEFGQKQSRAPLILESFNLAIGLIETKRLCDEYSKQGYWARFFNAAKIIPKLVEFNTQLNDRILTLNRNSIKIHASLEDLFIDMERMEKELGETKSEKKATPVNDDRYQDRISALESDQRQLKMMIANITGESGKSNSLIWGIAILVINILVTYGIVNSLN